MKKTCIGKFGGFYRDGKYDLSKNEVEQLPKKSYEPTCAPWDEQKDEKAAKHNEFMAKVHKAIDTAEELFYECRDLATGVEKLQDTLEQKTKEYNNAANKAKKLAKSAGIKWPSENTTEDADDSEGQAVLSRKRVGQTSHASQRS